MCDNVYFKLVNVLFKEFIMIQISKNSSVIVAVIMSTWLLSTFYSPASLAQSSFESQVNGEFEGWEGETLVQLVNGQVWIQSEYYYQYHYAYMPRVFVFDSGGTWKMKVEGISKAVGVRQLQ